MATVMAFETALLVVLGGFFNCYVSSTVELDGEVIMKAVSFVRDTTLSIRKYELSKSTINL
jgi:hypothetical protein